LNSILKSDARIIDHSKRGLFAEAKKFVKYLMKNTLLNMRVASLFHNSTKRKI